MPDLPGRLVGRADAVPEHVGDDRRAPVRHHDDLQAVGKRRTGTDFGRLQTGVGGRARAAPITSDGGEGCSVDAGHGS